MRLYELLADIEDIVVLYLDLLLVRCMFVTYAVKVWRIIRYFTIAFVFCLIKWIGTIRIIQSHRIRKIMRFGT